MFPIEPMTNSSKILIIDNQTSRQHQIAKLLIEREYQVEIIDAVGGGIRPDMAAIDLVLVAVDAGVPDGYDIAQTLRAEGATVPIIFMSGAEGSLDRARVFAIKNTDYLLQPFQPAEIWARLDYHLGWHQQEQALRQADERVEQRVVERTSALSQTVTLLEEQVNERQRAETALQKYADLLGVLHQIDQAILAAHSPTDIGLAALGHIRQLVTCEQAGMALFDFQINKAVLLAVSRSDGTELSTEAHLPLEAFGPVAELRQGQPLVEDISPGADLAVMDGRLLAEGLRSRIYAPLLSRDKLIGCLILAARQPGIFSVEHVAIAHEVAAQLAVALENARTHQTMLNLSQGLKEMLLERTHNLHVAQAELDYLDEAKSNFVSIASHELRTPLTTLQGYSQILLQNEVVKKDAYLSELMTTIHSSSIRLHEIINAMLDVAKIDSQTLELYRQSVSLASLVRQVVEKFEQPLAERHHRLDIKGLQELPDIEADVDMLEKVFSDVISNGVKYTPDGGHMTISGHYYQQEQKIELIISDNGIGIDPRFQELIFTKFYRADNLVIHSTGKIKFKGAGPGLGLTIARGIIEMHGGKIWVESPGYDEQTCPGSRFHILLPVSEGC